MTVPNTLPAASKPKRPSQNMFWRRFRKSTPGKTGAVIVVFFVLLALLAPLLRPYNPAGDRSYTDRLVPPSISALWNAEVRERNTDENGRVQYFKHPFGTDNLGRDIAVRVMHGTRISLQVGLIATMTALLIGSLLGVISGFFGGWFDQTTGYLSDLLLAFPGILLAIIIVAIIPNSGEATGPVGSVINWLAARDVDVRLYGAMLAVSIVQIPVYIRLARAVVLSVREREFVQAADALGAGRSRVIFRHVLPNSLTPLVVQGSLSIATATIEVAALGFLGLGATPPAPEWGTMIADAKDYYQSAPWTMIFPGLAILFTVLGFNLLGDGLRDVLDPRSTQ